MSLFSAVAGWSECKELSVGWFDRLRLDPGTRTFGELVQERQWALQEIARLRARISQLEYRPVRPMVTTPSESGKAIVDPSLNGMRLLRMVEVRQLVGLGASSIYKMISEGRFPAAIKIGARGVRWRMRDVLAWQERPG